MVILCQVQAGSVKQEQKNEPLSSSFFLYINSGSGSKVINFKFSKFENSEKSEQRESQ